MSIAVHGRTGGDAATKTRGTMLAPPLAALLYPFTLKGSNAAVTHIAEGRPGSFDLSWLSSSAAVCLALAFAIPLIAMLAAMSFSGISRPTAAQLRAKHANDAITN
jgi:hypothetical protein